MRLVGNPILAYFEDSIKLGSVTGRDVPINAQKHFLLRFAQMPAVRPAMGHTNFRNRFKEHR
jgi:hypothetical protein